MPYSPEQLPSGRWRGAVPVYENGRRRRIGATFDYEYEAREFIRVTEERLAAVDTVAATVTGTPAASAPEHNPTAPPRKRNAPTLAEHAGDWLNRRRRAVTSGTAGNYGRAVTAITAHRIAKAHLDLVRRSDVEYWIADMDDDDVPVSAVRLRIKVLRMIFRDAICDELVWRDPTAAIRLPTADIRPERNLTRAEDARLLLAGDPKSVAFCLLGLDAGLRWGEAAGLPNDGIDLARGRLTIRQVVERGSGLLRGFPKSHRARVVPMTDRLVAALRPLHEQALAARGRSGLLLATSHTGRQLGYDNWRRDTWYPARIAAGLADPQPRFHDLRHTYGTRLADRGVPRKEIAYLMGHADERTTGRYLHATDDETRASLVRAALA